MQEALKCPQKGIGSGISELKELWYDIDLKLRTLKSY